MIVGTQQVSSKKADKKDAEDNFDINELLDDLRKVIIKVYLSALDPKADLAAKNTGIIFSTTSETGTTWPASIIGSSAALRSLRAWGLIFRS